jgi:hypothetical protein
MQILVWCVVEKDAKERGTWWKKVRQGGN